MLPSQLQIKVLKLSSVARPWSRWNGSRTLRPEREKTWGTREGRDEGEQRIGIAVLCSWIQFSFCFLLACPGLVVCPFMISQMVFAALVWLTEDNWNDSYSLCQGNALRGQQPRCVGSGSKAVN